MRFKIGDMEMEEEPAPKRKPGRPRKTETPTSTNTPPQTTITRRPKESSSATGSPMVVPSSKAKWTPPTGSWEKHIQAVDTIEQDEDGLHVYLQWNDGRKTRHLLEVTYQRCPLRVSCPCFRLYNVLSTLPLSMLVWVL